MSMKETTDIPTSLQDSSRLADAILNRRRHSAAMRPTGPTAVNPSLRFGWVVA